MASLNIKIDSNKVKDLLVVKEFKKLQTFDSSYFIGTKVILKKVGFKIT